ncbi:MAG TPA: response regulator [Algoriphagus sp.]|jgi:CheY-like chemotaxis protein|uniref:response regulator n=1 Tax=unclassified Algoriphagus TaxID=2641541 RepID=UPI000C35BAF1|nr:MULTISPECIES: response regulator [unclassified Algoriphagus]MAL11880.1 response regulator [Algoriphagus sp.]MAN86533.1 response regulator [Algoriphagus sp.]HAD51684.1 response regulator [Algoriphagus sp.]HAH35620.1 response regulator [Algoriphagus sp.]HAZ26848.1 response regulator [Algoriphagus sp.]|tara:strand:- start:1058 stop:1447 length:390 start_codon:yes stop_codon:yes gene_type:complete
MIDLACLIEDDPIHVFLTEKFLGASGKVKELIRYANGEEAYFALKEKFEKKTPLPELILLDLNMPIWDGWQFLEEFTKLAIEKKIYIFILTSSIDSQDELKAQKYGMQDYFRIKPITANMVTEIFDMMD